jgi:hypothetical protein
MVPTPLRRTFTKPWRHGFVSDLLRVEALHKELIDLAMVQSSTGAEYRRPLPLTYPCGTSGNGNEPAGP